MNGLTVWGFRHTIRSSRMSELFFSWKFHFSSVLPCIFYSFPFFPFVPFFSARSNNHQCKKKHISSPSLAGHLKFNQTKQLLYPKLRKNIHQHLPWGHANISPHLHQTFHHIFTKHFRYLKFRYPPPPQKKKKTQKRLSQ